MLGRDEVTERRACRVLGQARNDLPPLNVATFRERISSGGNQGRAGKLLVGSIILLPLSHRHICWGEVPSSERSMKRFAIALLVIYVVCEGHSQALAQQADDALTKLPASAKKSYDASAKKVQKNRETYELANQKVLAGLKKDLEKSNPPVDVDAVISQFQQGIMALDANAKPPAPPPPEKGVLVFNGHRYKFVQEALTWDDAKARCEQMGGHLLTIEDRVEDKFIENELREFFGKNKNLPRQCFVWLGIKKDNNKWLTVDGRIQGYTHWDYGKPDPRFSYARMSVDAWYTAPVDVLEGLFFICEWDK